MNLLNIEEDTRVGVNALCHLVEHGVQFQGRFMREEGWTKKKMANKAAKGQILERWQFECVQGDIGRLTTRM